MKIIYMGSCLRFYCYQQARILLNCRLMSSSDHASSKQFVKIGTVKVPIHETKNPELVPAGHVTSNHPPTFVQALKWMLQKDLLKQDIFLLGTPGFTRINIVLQMLELCNREFEYLAITRDTTEADIKQRREIRSGFAFYIDLCAVKAALNGRVLIIDGVEMAERNVLPILNNLLENREMQLDDGRFLMAADKFDQLLKKYPLERLKELKLERVSEHFTIIALGLPIPTFDGHTLDPPLRSRFQCRHISQLPYDSMHALCESIAPSVTKSRITNLLSIVYGLNAKQQPEFAGIDTALKKSESETHHSEHGTNDLPLFPTDNLIKAAQIWNDCPTLAEEHIFHLCYPNAMLKTDSQQPLLNKFKKKFGIEPAARLDMRWTNTEKSTKNFDGVINDEKKASQSENNNRLALAKIAFDEQSFSEVKIPCGNLLFQNHQTATEIDNENKFVTSAQLEHLLTDLLLAHSAADFCLLGPRGSGKSTIMHEFARRLGYETETIMLYQDMNSRELLQRRRMLDDGDTVWDDSQLVRAAKEGKLCLLDGIDRVHSSMAESLSTLIHHRFLTLPDGTRLIGHTSFNLLKHKTGFTEQELNKRQIFCIASNFRLVALGDSDSASKWLNPQLNSMFLFSKLPELTLEDKLKLLQHKIPNASIQSAKKLLKLVERLTHSHDASIRAIASCLSIRRLMHILRRQHLHPEEGIYDAVHRAALARFLPPVVKRAFESILHDLGICPDQHRRQQQHQHHKKIDGKRIEEKWWELSTENTPKKSLTSSADVHAAVEAMVPSTLFFDNSQHLQVMADMARDLELGSHLLLIGNQGVGKNKVTDRLLQLLNRPRKYMQLHRDTTVQSLTIQSTVENGILRYEDSPLVTAVCDGYVLIIDEADKAPLHVVAILKSLLDSEPFYLSDGRRVCPAHELLVQQNRPKEFEQQNIYVHPQFRMIMLANRPGFPFLGNDLYALLGDLLSVHALDNPSPESELEMLAKYGPNVPTATLELLISVFGELRRMVDQSLISYPYSTRELVNIVKHLQRFLDETIDQAVRNVFDFDVYSLDTMELIREAFERRGIKIAIGTTFNSSAKPDAYGNWDRLLGRGDQLAKERIQIERDGATFDISKLLDPKFGKIDPDNMPHIGGNTWAGGVGGYSTAGLGGVGGPFRLDAGHPVHQMPESVKQQVPEHILQKARELAKQEYAKRLKEIEMSEYDAEAYNQLASHIGKQVRVLRGIIDSLESQQHERQWAKHQTSGDLDDAKLIESMTGDKNIYRKRVDHPPDPSTQAKPKRIRLCFDVSGSMYRFNGYDHRLQRSLEAALLVMEALDGKSDKIKYDIFGHSGESPEVPFVTMDRLPTNEKERLNVLKRMLAHSQFCVSGDYTVEALTMAVKELKAETDEFDERFVVLLSDANLDRYGIRPAELRKALQLDESVNAFVVLIGSLGEQATILQRALPAGKAFLAMNAAQIPEIMQQIFASTIAK